MGDSANLFTLQILCRKRHSYIMGYFADGYKRGLPGAAKMNDKIEHDNIDTDKIDPAFVDKLVEA